MHDFSIHIERPGKEVEVMQWHFPEGHHEFTRPKLYALARYIDTIKTDDLAYVRLVRAMLAISRRAMKYVDPELLFFPEKDDEGEVQVLPELSYLKETYKNATSLMRRVGPWIGPDDGLKNMSIEQVAFADSLAAAYRKEPTPSLLNQAWASMYTLPGMTWKASRIEAMATLARMVPRITKLAALLNYRGMLLANIDHFPHVYTGGETDGTEVFGWEGTIQRLAKAQTFGPYQQAKNIGFLQAMTMFEMNSIEIKNLEKQRKKQLKK